MTGEQYNGSALTLTRCLAGRTCTLGTGITTGFAAGGFLFRSYCLTGFLTR